MPSLPSFVRLLPQKGEKLFQSESSLGYSEGFLFHKTFKYYMTEKKRNIYHILKRPFQNIKPFPTSFKFQNYAEVFLPSDIQIGMVVRFLRNIQTMLFIISCQSIQSISLQVIPVFAGASQLSAEQEHQREQVNHLALTSGGDLFPRLHLFPQLFT